MPGGGFTSQPDDPVRGESNSVPLRGMPQAQNRLVTLTAATPASSLIDMAQEGLAQGGRRDVTARLQGYGDQTLAQVLNELVTNDSEYREKRDDQKLADIQAIIRDYSAAARAQVVREFPEIQQRRDRMPTRQQGAQAVPF